MPANRLRDHLSARLPDYLDALRQAVDVNSFTENPAGVNRVGDRTAELFASLGFRAERVPSSDSRFGRHLFLSRPGAPGRHVAFISHLDTVFPPEEEITQGFTWREEGDRLYGPGTAGIKGGTLVAYMALDALHAVRPGALDAVSWLVALDAAEEQMKPDFAQRCRERLPQQETLACLVLECGAEAADVSPAVVARKGKVIFRVRVEGKAAHAGTGFWHGRNAILDAARVALDLAALSDRDRDLTVNVGTVSGGTVSNRVPHLCLLEAEVRAFDPAVLREAMERVQEVVSAAPARVEFFDELPAWPRNPGSDHLLGVWRRAGERIGLRVEEERRAGLSDGNLLWNWAPTLDGLGPVGGNCHCSQRGPDGTGQEYVLRSSFVPKALLTATALLELIASRAHGAG